MGLPSAIAAMLKRMLLHGTAFSDRKMNLRLLYSLEDPWGMASEREQYRFSQTNAQLAGIMPRYDSILELGSGEGHQSTYLQKLTSRLHGIDISSRASIRARRRCKKAQFVVGEVDQVLELFPNIHFDLITACEVLYYAGDPGAILPRLQQRTRYLYVSNYLPRSELMRKNFQGEGWRELPPIHHGKTEWECFLWEAPIIEQGT